MADTDLLDGIDEELAGTGPQERDWRGMAIAIFVILIICSLIGVAVLVFTPLSANRDPDHLIQQLYDTISISPVHSLAWFNENNIHFIERNGTNFLLDVRTNDAKIVWEHISPYDLHIFNKDYSFVALKALNPIYDHVERPTFGYKIVDLKDYTIYAPSRSDIGFQAFDWSPVPPSYAFVEDGQLYVVDKPGLNNKTKASYLNPDKINGVNDWVYTEEISNRESLAFWWSENGKQIAFVSYDANNVEKMKMPKYDSEQPYPVDIIFSYPKTAAKHLPVYALNIFDRDLGQMRPMDVQLRRSTEFQYLYSVTSHTMYGEPVFAAVWATRYQNDISLTLCSFSTGICHLMFEYHYSLQQWAEPSNFQSMICAGNSLYFVLPQPNADGNVYNNIVRLDIPRHWRQGERGTLIQLPPVPFEVVRILRHDNGFIYYTAGAPTPSDTHVYAAPTVSNSKTMNMGHKCVTCFSDDCKSQEGIQFSHDGKRVIIECRGPGLPYVIHGIVANNSLAKISRALTPESYTEKLKKFVQPHYLEEEIVLDNRYVARVHLMLPCEPLRCSKPLPVLLKVYNGPNANVVSSRFHFDFESYLTMSKSMAVLQIDARGSGRRGWKYRSPIYGALGTAEMEDQVSAFQKIIAKHNYLDKTRAAVYGWSYGGFASVNIVRKAPMSTFKCAISVAPVSNFIFYDATYTERYMGNASRSAYDAGDVASEVSKFRNTRLLLMHGLADDNVHFQNSAMLIKKMQQENIDFDLMVFPNRDHSLSPGPYAKMKMASFIDKCLLS